MKITNICEAPGRDPKADALMTARKVLVGLHAFFKDAIQTPNIHGKQITSQALLNLMKSYMPDIEKGLRAIEAIREGKATPAQIKTIMEFDQSKLGKHIQQLIKDK